MKKYSFKNINCVYVLGSSDEDYRKYLSDIKSCLYVKDEDVDKEHPKELERQARRRAREEAAMATRSILRSHNGLRLEYPSHLSKASKRMKGMSKYSNSIIIITGDAGIGMNNTKGQMEAFGNLNKVLEYNNAFIIFIRGNHDNAEFFDGEKINFSNLKAIPDYSVIEANGENILCIGGAVTIDREWRKKQEERINSISQSSKKRLYCENEMPVFDASAIEEITKEIKIDYVISHSAPSFATPENKGMIDEWIEKDESLKTDIEQERLIMDKVFNMLSECGMKPKYWAYSHFNMAYIERRSNTIFRSLSSNQGFCPISLSWDVAMFIANEEGNKKKKKSAKLSAKMLEPTEELHPVDPDQHQEEEFADEPRRMFDEELVVEDRHEDAVIEVGEPIGVTGNNNTFEIHHNNHNDLYERIRRELNEAATLRATTRRNNNAINFDPFTYAATYTVTTDNTTNITTDAVANAAFADVAGAAFAVNDDGEGHG